MERYGMRNVSVLRQVTQLERYALIYNPVEEGRVRSSTARQGPSRLKPRALHGIVMLRSNSVQANMVTSLSV